MAQGKPYALDNPSKPGKTFLTDQYALVSHGNATKPWPFSACSDSHFHDSEFQRYKDTLTKEHVRLPKKAFLLQKLDDLNNFLNVQWTDPVLAGKFARQKEMERRTDPANAAKAKREGIEKRKAEAENNNDSEEAARCDAELAALDLNASAANGSVTAAAAVNLAAKIKSPPKASQQDRLAALNSKNRGKNTNDVRQALLTERKKLQRDRERAHAEALEAAAKRHQDRLDRQEADRARASLLAVPGGKSEFSELFGDTPDISRAGTPMSGTSTPRLRRSRAGTPVNGGSKPQERSGLGLLGKKKKGEVVDELGGIDLGIDVEI